MSGKLGEFNMDLASRMKTYEKVSDVKLTRRVPVIIRIDGRAFHSYTRGLEKPFSTSMMDAMVSSAYQVAQDMSGFKVAYVQSDEVTFCLTDYDTHDTEPWFDYRVNKLVSIAASHMSVLFNYQMLSEVTKNAMFDARAFNIPMNEVSNMFLWRARDWKRNSLHMFARTFFSAKELFGKRQSEVHEMLHKIGQNWINCTPRERNGTFIIENQIRHDILPTYDSISKIIDPLIAYPTTFKEEIKNDNEI
jgi:tRNA(His) guanylyltransferase